MVLPVNRVQSPISTANPNPVSKRDAAQAAQPAHDRRVLAARGQVGDLPVEPVPAVGGEQHLLVAGVERGPRPARSKRLARSHWS